MATLFKNIIEGKIPCYKIEENDQFLAFLDINPLAKGHALVIPKVEVDYIFDVKDEMLAEMMIFAKNVALRIENKISCKRMGVAVIGLEVPHAHIHLVPLNSVEDINFSRPKLSFSSEEMEETLVSILS